MAVLRLSLLSWTLFVSAAYAQEVHPDIVAVLNVTGGVTPGGVSWADSYSVGDECYCATTFDHNIGPFYVETPIGWLTVRQVCDLLGPGPGRTDDTPVYNDIGCGNGPPNNAGDEHVCPGRVDIGEAGCGHIGPVWNFSNLSNTSNGVPSYEPPDDAHPDIRAFLNVTGGVVPNSTMANSYSVGDDSCYCISSLDDGVSNYFANTPLGWKTVREVCDIIGPGPGVSDTSVLYNDVQCGNGPPSAEGHEHACPGRVDIGEGGCGHIGPKWNFAVAMSGTPSTAPGMESSGMDTDQPSMTAPTMTSAPVTMPTMSSATSAAIEGKIVSWSTLTMLATFCNVVAFARF